MGKWPTEWEDEIDYQDDRPPVPTDWTLIPELIQATAARNAAVIAAVRTRDLPYRDYLRTPWWRYIRQQALDVAGRRCEAVNENGRRCGSWDRLQVHHLTYERLGEERPEDLVVLCARHHLEMHGLEHDK